MRSLTSHSSTEKMTNGKVEEVELRDGQIYSQPNRRQKLKRHCQRFWWLHLIVFCLSFLTIALILVYVAYPRKAQSDVNATTLTITELKFLNPAPDTITITQIGTLHSSSVFSPTIDAFNASVYLVSNGTRAANPFSQFQMPSIHPAAQGDTQVSIQNQIIQISDPDSLAGFAIATLSSRTVTSEIVGRSVLHLGGLPAVSITYDTLTTFPSLDGLKGFNVTNVAIDLAAKAGEPNLRGVAQIPNKSIMTIAMGNVTLDLSTAAAGIVGNCTINDMTLVPGNNSFAMSGVLDQSKVLKSMVNGMVDLIIVGRSAVYDGQHLLYYEKALAAQKLSLVMNVTQVLADSVKRL